MNETDRVHVVHVSHVFGSRHGGSAYSTAMIETLLTQGAEVTLLAERFEDDAGAPSAPQARRTAMPHLFRARFWNLVSRTADIARLWRIAFSAKRTVVMVQGDLPRMNYVILQLFVPVLFIRQDSILTCPANHRFLPRSRKVCLKPPGFSCLAVHAREQCLGGVSALHRIGRILFRLRDDLLLRCLRQFVGNSRATLQRHRRKGIVIHPPTADPGAVTDMSRRNLKQIAFCGRLAPGKGAEDAIRIVAALPDEYRLAIIGDGALRDALEAQAASLEATGRVEFHGWLAAAERDALLAESGLLLMPSLCHEGFGMAGIEAFTQGTPAVAYDVGGIAEWCSADAGVLVPCGDIAAATVAIRGLVEDPARWRQFSEAARTIAATRFPRGRFSREILSVIRGATGYTMP